MIAAAHPREKRERPSTLARELDRPLSRGMSGASRLSCRLKHLPRHQHLALHDWARGAQGAGDDVHVGALPVVCSSTSTWPDGCSIQMVRGLASSGFASSCAIEPSSAQAVDDAYRAGHRVRGVQRVRREIARRDGAAVARLRQQADLGHHLLGTSPMPIISPALRRIASILRTAPCPGSISTPVSWPVMPNPSRAS